MLDTQRSKAIQRALESGIPKMRLLEGTQAEIILHGAKKGGTISDPDCEDDYQTLQDGTYFRIEMTKNGTDHALKWMFLCPTEDTGDYLRLRAENTGLTGRDLELALDGATVEAVWQSVQYRDNLDRAKNRAQIVERRRLEAEETVAMETTGNT